MLSVCVTDLREKLRDLSEFSDTAQTQIEIQHPKAIHQVFSSEAQLLPDAGIFLQQSL